VKSIKLGGSRFLVVATALTVAALAYLDVQNSAAGEAAAPGGRGVAQGRSSRAGEVEAQINRTNLRGKMEAVLGDAFGGVWFEPSTAQVHVGVTSSASRRSAEAVAVQAGMEEDVTETPVDSTWSQLEGAQARLNRHLEDLFARGEVSTSLAPDENSVKVELSPAVPASRRAELRREASATGVEVSISVASSSRILATAEAAPRCKKFEPDKAYCEKPIVAGVTIESNTNKKCTAGPAVFLQDTLTAEDATDTYLLTAGHCIKESTGVEWFAFTKAGDKKKIGGVDKALHGERGAENKNRIDAGVIFLNNPGEWVNKGSNVPVNPTIAPWDKNNEVDPFAVTAQAPLPMEGTMSCISGQTSGTSCGEVIEESKSETFDTGTTADKLVEVKGATTAKGDSGAPWFPEDHRGEVQGTHVGSSGKGNALFQPLKYTFEELVVTIIGSGGQTSRLQLLKTANQNRHPDEGRFTSQVEETFLLGAQKTLNVFTTTAGEVQCAEAEFEGTEDEVAGGGLGFEVERATVHPTYSSCTAFGFPAEVNTGVCEYNLYASGTIDITNCAIPIKITTPIAGCNITVGNQNGLSSVSYTNEGSGSTADILVTANVSGIAYTSSGGLCGSSGINGTNTGGVLTKGFSDSGHTTQVGIAWDAS
jgi:hypothetical protein